jgi:hypothetical protein
MSEESEPELRSEPDPDEETELDPAAVKRRRNVEQERRALGSWRQDREMNRRKVLRSLVWLAIIVVLTSFLAYGCSQLRGPRQLELNPSVGTFALLAPTNETEQLRGQFEAAGATGPTAGRYRNGATEVLLAVGVGTDLPTVVLGSLLPPVTGGESETPGRGGPVACGATATGSRCLWKSGDIVGGTSANGVSPEVLDGLTRDLRAGAVRG